LDEINDTETPIVEEQKPVKHKRRPWWVYVLFAFALLLFSVQVFFMHFANPLLKFYIQKAIFTESKGIYSISFEEFNINLRHRKISLKGFNLLPDTALYNRLRERDSVQKALYKIEIEEISLSGIDFKLLRDEKILWLNEIEVKKPNLRIIGLPKKLEKNKNQKYDAIHNDLFPALAPYLNALKVNKIKLTNGYIDLYMRPQAKRRASVVNNVSIVLTDFYVDSINYLKRDRLFYSKSIEVGVKNYKMEFADSVHVLRAVALKISSADSVVSVFGVSMQPASQLTRKILMRRNKDYFEVHVPEIHIKGFDINKAYFDKMLVISKVLLDEPDLQIFDINKVKRQSNVKFNPDIDLFSLIAGKLHKLQVDTFKLNSGSFSVYGSTSKHNKDFAVGDLSVDLFNFQVDSLAVYNEKKILYSDDIDFRIRNYFMKLKDGRHTLSAGELFVSTGQSKIFANNVVLRPLAGMNTKVLGNKALMSIQVPHVQLVNIDLIEAFNQHFLPISSLKLYNPIATIHVYRDSTYEEFRKNKKQGITGDELAKLMSAYLNEISITQLKTENVSFKLNYFYNNLPVSDYSGNLSLDIKDFRINPYAEMGLGKVFYAGDMLLDFNNYRMSFDNGLHELKTDKLLVSTHDSLVSVSNFSIKPLFTDSMYYRLVERKKYQYYKVGFEKFSMKGIDIPSAYFNGEILVKSIAFDKMNFDLYTYNSLKPVQLDTLKIRKKQEFKNVFGKFFLVEELPDSNLIAGKLVPINEISYLYNSVTGLQAGFISPIIISNIFVRMPDFKIKTEQKEVIDFEMPANAADSLKMYRLFANRAAKNGIFSSLLQFPYELSRYSINGADSLPDNVVEYHRNRDEMTVNDSLLFTDETKLVKPDTILLATDSIVFSDTIKTPTELPDDTPDFYDMLSKFIINVSVNSASVNSGKFNLYTCDSVKQERIVASNGFEFELTNFNFSPNSVEKNQKLLFSDNLDFKFRNVEFLLKDRVHSVTADLIGVSTEKRELSATGLVLKSNISSTLTDLKAVYIDFVFPEVKLTGLDFEQAYLGKMFKASKLTVYKPLIQLTGTKKFRELRGLLPPIRKQPLMPKGISAIEFDSVSFTNGKFEFLNLMPGRKSVVLSSELVLDAAHVRIDSTNFINYFENDRLPGLDQAEITLANPVVFTGDSIHRLTADAITYFSARKQAHITGLAFKPFINSDTLQMLVKWDKSSLYRFYSPYIQVDSASIGRLIKTKNIDFGKLSITSPFIEVVTYKSLTKPKKFHWTETDLYPLLQKIAPEIRIRNLQLANGIFVLNTIDSVNKQLRFNKLDLHMTEFFVSDTVINPKNIFKYAQKMRIKLPNFEIPLKDTLNRLFIDSLIYNTATAKLTIHNFSAKPKLDKYDFVNETNKTYIESNIGRLVVTKLDLQKALRDQVYLADKVYVDAGNLTIFRDKAKARQKNDSIITKKRQPLLQETIKRIPLNFKVDSVLFNRSAIVFEELAPDAPFSGFFVVTGVNGFLSNLTNIPTEYAKNQVSVGQINGDLMSKGKFTSELKFNMNDPKSKLVFDGNLAAMELKEFNRYTKPNTGLDISSGTLKSGHFTMQADDSITTGAMRMRYNDLKVSILRNIESDTVVSKRGFTSWIANSILRTNNPKRGFLRGGEILAKRDTTESMLSYWLDGILSGIKSTVIFDSKDQKLARRFKAKAEAFEQRMRSKEARNEAKAKRLLEKQVKRLERKGKKKNKNEGLQLPTFDE